MSGIAADPTYLDVSIAPHATFVQPIARGHTAFTYVFDGEARFGAKDQTVITEPRLVVWEDGDTIDINTGKSPVRFLLVSGKPLGEPIARYGPFVMNTREEIEQTLREIRDGTFAQ